MSRAETEAAGTDAVRSSASNWWPHRRHEYSSSGHSRIGPFGHRLKKLLVPTALLCPAGLTVLLAQRIPTNPADDHLKMLFPTAAAFSAHEGVPLHHKAYAVDPRTSPSVKPIGYVFWTTDLVPDERGYHGAIHVLVGMDTAGIITGVVVDWNAEPYGYYSVDPPGFAAQFKGKSVRDPFRVGADVDAVSGASITINSAARAIRDSSRTMAKTFLTRLPAGTASR